MILNSNIKESNLKFIKLLVHTAFGGDGVSDMPTLHDLFLYETFM
jgi:hypothetical protein